jgi:hypothetical protein
MTEHQPLTEERLAELLTLAKDAHAEYERQTGEYDQDWPRWYARFILERLDADKNTQRTQ